MEKTKQPPKSMRDRGRGPVEPEVILDFVFEDEAIFLELRNISTRPLNFVNARFEPPVTGLGGTQAIGKLPVFNREFLLAPGKVIKTLVDVQQTYFHRKEPTRITVTVQYRDFRGRDYQVELQHDLEVYQKLITQIPQ